MIGRNAGRAAAVALAAAVAVMPDLASAASPARAGAAEHAPVAWVVNQSRTSSTAGSVTPIDTAANAVLKTIPVPGNAIALALAPDRRTAYVALNATVSGGHASVVAVSTSTYRAGKPVTVPVSLPGGMLVTPNGKTVYVADLNSATVATVDTATGTAGKAVSTGTLPTEGAMAITPNGRTLYVVNSGAAGSGTVTPVDTAASTAGKPIPVGVTPGAIVMSRHGRTAYVLNLAEGETGQGSVTPVDTATNTAGKPIKLPGQFPDLFNLLAMAPNGRTLYALSNNAVVPVDTWTGRAGRAIPVAPADGGNTAMAVAPDGRTVYVVGSLGPGFTSGYVVPVSTATGTAGKPAVFQGVPSAVAITPNGKTLYVVCAGGPGGTPQDILPVATATNTPGPAISTGLQPEAIEIASGRHWGW